MRSSRRSSGSRKPAKSRSRSAVVVQGSYSSSSASYSSPSAALPRRQRACSRTRPRISLQVGGEQAELGALPGLDPGRLGQSGHPGQLGHQAGGQERAAVMAPAELAQEGPVERGRLQRRRGPPPAPPAAPGGRRPAGEVRRSWISPSSSARCSERYSTPAGGRKVSWSQDSSAATWMRRWISRSVSFRASQARRRAQVAMGRLSIQYFSVLPPMNSRSRESPGTTHSSLQAGISSKKAWMRPARSSASVRSGSPRNSRTNSGKKDPGALLHDRQLVGQEAVDDDVRLPQARDDVAQLAAAHEMPVLDGLLRAVVAELHVAHHAPQQAHVGPAQEPPLAVLHLGQGLDVEAELPLRRHPAGHLGGQAVQGVDEQDLLLPQPQAVLRAARGGRS